MNRRTFGLVCAAGTLAGKASWANSFTKEEFSFKYRDGCIANRFKEYSVENDLIVFEITGEEYDKVINNFKCPNNNKYHGDGNMAKLLLYKNNNLLSNQLYSLASVSYAHNPIKDFLNLRFTYQKCYTNLQD